MNQILSSIRHGRLGARLVEKKSTRPVGSRSQRAMNSHDGLKAVLAACEALSSDFIEGTE